MPRCFALCTLLLVGILFGGCARQFEKASTPIPPEGPERERMLKDVYQKLDSWLHEEQQLEIHKDNSLIALWTVEDCANAVVYLKGEHMGIQKVITFSADDKYKALDKVIGLGPYPLTREFSLTYEGFSRVLTTDKYSLQVLPAI